MQTRFSSKLKPWRSFALLFIGLLGIVAIVGSGGGGSQETPPPKAGAWLVFLCQASDAPVEPHTLDYYKELFAAGTPDLVTDFFQKTSNGMIDTSGTEVYGWFKMSVSTATIAPAVRNNSTQPNRSQTAQDCKTAGAASFLASGKAIDPTKYAGFIAVVNVVVDAGMTGASMVANQDEPASFYQHEMLHVSGQLNHSWVMAPDASADHNWEHGIDREYNDCWDIMSYATCTYAFATSRHGGSGPELEMAYRAALGWLAPTRVFVKDTADRMPSTVTLSPVSEPNRPGPLLARIEVAGGPTYMVEYRVKTGFDRGIVDPAVVIRELRHDRKTYLVTRQNGSIGWGVGERFTDESNFLSITVDTMNAQSARITIDPVYSTAAKVGDVCGNKYVGQIRSCPAGSFCDARRTPPLVTIDYFCQ